MSENTGIAPFGRREQPGTTTFAVDLKFGVVVVREVLRSSARRCGDAWIDDPVAAKLEASLRTRAANNRGGGYSWQQVAA